MTPGRTLILRLRIIRDKVGVPLVIPAGVRGMRRAGQAHAVMAHGHAQ